MCPGRSVNCTTQGRDVDNPEPMHVQGRRYTENLDTFCPTAPPEPQTALKNTIYRKTDSNTEANKAQIFEAE